MSIADSQKVAIITQGGAGRSEIIAAPGAGKTLVIVGIDVAADAAGTLVWKSGLNEVVTITVNATSGTLDLIWNAQTNANVPFDVSSSALQTSIDANWGLTAGDVVCSTAPTATGNVITLTFTHNTVGGTNVSAVTKSDTNLIGGTHSSTVTTVDGAATAITGVKPIATNGSQITGFSGGVIFKCGVNEGLWVTSGTSKLFGHVAYIIDNA